MHPNESLQSLHINTSGHIINTMIDERALNIYTDGSAKPTPRRGGIGVMYIYVDVEGNEISEALDLPGYQSATISEMELNACIVALENAGKYLQRVHFSKIIIFTDSMYVYSNHKNAMFLWPRKKWLKSSGAPVLNAQLWKDLIKLIRNIGLRVEFQKVKAHSSDLYNRAVDKLAKKSASIPLNKPLAISTVRRKKSKQKTNVGSVQMLGQRISIRIIECKYLSVQRLYRYRYEVVSRSSPFYKEVDFLCSTYELREAHTFSVRMNTETKNPRIIKLYREIISKSKLPVLKVDDVASVTSLSDLQTTDLI